MKICQVETNQYIVKMVNKLLIEKDVPILDSILETAIRKGKVFPDDLSPIGSSSLSEIASVKFEKYKYYFEIIECYDVLKITNFSGGYSFWIELIEVKTKIFYANGGFKAIYEEQQQEIKKKRVREKKEDQKLEWDLQVSKFQAKTKWWPLIISVISIIIAIWSFFK